MGAGAPAPRPTSPNSGSVISASRAVSRALRSALRWSHIRTPSHRARCREPIRRQLDPRPQSPSGQCTGPALPSASPSPKWIHPSSPLAWPPPIVTSRWATLSPVRTSTHAPIASGLGPGCSSQARPNGPWAPVCGLAGAHVPPQAHVPSTVDLDEIEHAVEVQIDHAAPRPRIDCTMPAAPPLSRTSRLPLPSSRLFGSLRREVRLVSTLPLETNRSTNPSLFTSWNSACHAVDGSSRRPCTAVGGHAGRSAMSRSWAGGPAARVWSLLSPWLVRNTSGGRRR